MKLLTEELKKQLPKIYSQEKVKDPIVYAKFFFPMGRGTWYAYEYDPKEQLFFGWVKSPLGADMDEIGYFSLAELESVSVHGLHIERDRYFSPMPLSWVRNGERDPEKKSTRYTAVPAHKARRSGASAGIGSAR